MEHEINLGGFIDWLKRPEAEVFFGQVAELRDGYDNQTHNNLDGANNETAIIANAKMEVLNDVLGKLYCQDKEIEGIPGEIINELKEEKGEE